jgi:amino acid transporter
MVVGFAVMIACGGVNISNTFLWSGTIGTLILLVVYVLTMIGAIMLVFVQRKLPVPSWQIIIPIAAIVVLGYTIYRNIIPWPPAGVARNLPLTAGAWIVVSVIVVLAFPAAARKLGQRLAAEEGFATERANA